MNRASRLPGPPTKRPVSTKAAQQLDVVLSREIDRVKPLVAKSPPGAFSPDAAAAAVRDYWFFKGKAEAFQELRLALRQGEISL